MFEHPGVATVQGSTAHEVLADVQPSTKSFGTDIQARNAYVRLALLCKHETHRVCIVWSCYTSTKRMRSFGADIQA